MAKSASPALAVRAILALALMIGFFVLAIAIAGALLYIPYAEWTYAHRLHFKLAFFCVVGAGIILWSMLPRPDRFTPPGPRLEPAQHPRLFAELTGIAKAVGQPMPADVFLVPEVNAWVSQRGGIMGFGSRRVMGLGLPLLRMLTTSQLKAVLAHEFGHYHGGDTKLGPWIYKTRFAIVRTLHGLAGHSSLLQMPFLWYGEMFLRITHAVSRHQEFAADQLAARTVGSQPLVTGLRTIHGAGLAWSSFLTSEVAPVVNVGFRPPLAEGFACFFQAPPVAHAISSALEQEIIDAKTDPYDTHPPLRDRIAAIQNSPLGAEPADDPAAISLLEGLPELERQILALMSGDRALKPVSWDKVGEQVYMPMWESMRLKEIVALSVVTAGSLPEASRQQSEFMRRSHTSPGVNINHVAATTIGAALAIALIKRGWLLDVSPGAEVSLQLGEESIKPFAVFPQLVSGELAADAWRSQCAALGIGDVNLATGERVARGIGDVSLVAAERDGGGGIEATSTPQPRWRKDEDTRVSCPHCGHFNPRFAPSCGKCGLR